MEGLFDFADSIALWKDIRFTSEGHLRYTQLAKMSLDKIFDLTAGVYFYFYDIVGGQ